MSDIEWTEKDINRAYRRLIHKKSWIKVVDIKSGNKPASDYRRLMKLMVDRKLAFDNEINPESNQYQICFNLSEKNRILEELGDSIKHNRFDDSVLSDPIILDLPPLDFFDYIKTKHEVVCFDVIRSESIEIRKAFSIYQSGNKIENYSYYYSCNPSIGIDLKEYDEQEKLLFCLKANKFINMYKALKVGWEEIKNIFPLETYNSLFLKMLRAYYIVNFVSLVNSEIPKRKYQSERRKLTTILGFSKFLRYEIEILSKNSDIPNNNYYKLLLEEYDRSPYGQGIEEAFRSLIEIAKQETRKNYILDKIEDFYKSFSMIGGFPRCNSFDELLLCYDTEESRYYDDPQLDYLTKLYQGFWIKEALRTSVYPRVRKSVLDWDESTTKMIEAERTRSRWLENNAEKRP